MLTIRRTDRRDPRGAGARVDHRRVRMADGVQGAGAVRSPVSAGGRSWAGGRSPAYARRLGATADDPAGSADDRLGATWRILTTGTWLASVTGAFAALLGRHDPRYLGSAVPDQGAGVRRRQGPGQSSSCPGPPVAVHHRRRAPGEAAAPAQRPSRWARGGLSEACVVTAGVAMLGIPLVDVDWARICCSTVAFSVGRVGQSRSGRSHLSRDLPEQQRGGVLRHLGRGLLPLRDRRSSLTGSFIGSAARRRQVRRRLHRQRPAARRGRSRLRALRAAGPDRARLAALTAQPQRTLRRKPA
ncbi:hypothetical protein HBB16_21460 [Pseudonocardia sp. MCCB 268]|nr:hypothetical protein [Pseudonocardia cytotoxica]